MTNVVRSSPSGPLVDVLDSQASGISVLDYLTGNLTLVEAINAALADTSVEATEIYFPPGNYPITSTVSSSVEGKIVRFVPGAVLLMRGNGLGTLTLNGANSALIGDLVARFDTATSVTYAAIDLHGTATRCERVRFEIDAEVPNCSLLRLSGDYSEVGPVTYAGRAGSFKYGTEMSRQDGTPVLYARAGLQLWQMEDDGVMHNFTAVLRYRAVRSQAGPISHTSGGRHSFVAVIEVDGQHNSLLDPQINVSLSQYGILLKDDSEFFGILGGEIVGGYRVDSVGIQWGDGSKPSGTPAIGQGKLFDAKIRNWEYGCVLTGSADAPMFNGCFIGNNRTAEVMIDSQRGADIWPVSALSFYGCYRESAAFPGAGVPFLLLRTGAMRGGLMAGCEIGADIGVVLMAEAAFSTNNMQFEGCRFSFSSGASAVTEPNANSDFYFGLNDFQGSSLISRGAFASRATSFRAQVVTTSTISSLTIGATGTAMTLRLASFGTANFAAGIPANDFVELTFSFPNTLSTDYLNWTLIGALSSNTSLLFHAWLSASGTVTLRARNLTAIAVGAVSGTILFQAFRGLP